MKYPEFIKKNDRLGFIAPSFGCASLEPYHTRFQEALNYFQGIGYEPVIGANVYLEEGVGKSTTPEKCGTEINDFFLTDRCDAVLSVGGGETMCEDLNYVDFDALSKAKPKWFMGYSDNTNLIYTLATICDVASIYGPNASSFGTKPQHPFLKDTVALLEGSALTVHNYDSWEIESLASPENPLATLNCTEPFQMSVHNYAFGTPVRGRMLGGCLDVLANLCGTKFDHTKAFTEKYAADGTIFFLESCDLNPLSILRSLWQLRNAGWFDNTKAFLFGRPLHIKESLMGLDCRAAVLHVLGDMGVPIFFDLDIGHLPPQMPILCGAVGTVCAEGNSISVTYSLE